MAALDGDGEIAPGVSAIFTPGHTPGHQSFVVDLDESVGGGGLVFAFDAADLQENIDQEVAVGSFINCEPARTIESIRHLKSVALRRGYDIVPGHDPVAWPRSAKPWRPASATPDVSGHLGYAFAQVRGPHPVVGQ